jgi:hypothetical protein
MKTLLAIILFTAMNTYANIFVSISPTDCILCNISLTKLSKVKFEGLTVVYPKYAEYIKNRNQRSTLLIDAFLSNSKVEVIFSDSLNNSLLKKGRTSIALFDGRDLFIYGVYDEVDKISIHMICSNMELIEISLKNNEFPVNVAYPVVIGSKYGNMIYYDKINKSIYDTDLNNNILDFYSLEDSIFHYSYNNYDSLSIAEDVSILRSVRVPLVNVGKVKMIDDTLVALLRIPNVKKENSQNHIMQRYFLFKKYGSFQDSNFILIEIDSDSMDYLGQKFRFIHYYDFIHFDNTFLFRIKIDIDSEGFDYLPFLGKFIYDSILQKIVFEKPIDLILPQEYISSSLFYELSGANFNTSDSFITIVFNYSRTINKILTNNYSPIKEFEISGIPDSIYLVNQNSSGEIKVSAELLGLLESKNTNIIVIADHQNKCFKIEVIHPINNTCIVENLYCDYDKSIVYIGNKFLYILQKMNSENYSHRLYLPLSD